MRNEAASLSKSKYDLILNIVYANILKVIIKR